MEDAVGRRVRREASGIDDLPDGVLENIVNMLDFPEAVRAGLVAKPWRNCWKFAKVLNFDYKFYQEFIEGTNYKLDAVVNSILRGHVGPISKFEINYTHQEPNVSFDISEGVHILSEKRVEQLDIYAVRETHLELPSEIYNFSSLVDLNLQHCKLGDAPTCFEGFPNLRSIRLADVIVPENALRLMISHSPQLSQIDFECHSDDNPVELHQAAALTNLESIYYQCKETCRRPLRLSTRLPNLECALIETQLELPGRPLRTSKLDYFSSLIPRVKDLSIGDDALISLADNVVPSTLTSQFTYLDDLSLDLIDISSETLLSYAFCIIRNAPRLKALGFHVFQDNNADNIAAAMNVISQQLTLPPLEVIDTLSFVFLTNTDLELELIRTLIQLCPRLRSVYFKPSSITEIEEEQELHDKLEDIPLPEDALFEFEWADRDE